MDKLRRCLPSRWATGLPQHRMCTGTPVGDASPHSGRRINRACPAHIAGQLRAGENVEYWQLRAMVKRLRKSAKALKSADGAQRRSKLARSKIHEAWQVLEALRDANERSGFFACAPPQLTDVDLTHLLSFFGTCGRVANKQALRERNIGGTSSTVHQETAAIAAQRAWQLHAMARERVLPLLPASASASASAAEGTDDVGRGNACGRASQDPGGARVLDGPNYINAAALARACAGAGDHALAWRAVKQMEEDGLGTVDDLRVKVDMLAPLIVCHAQKGEIAPAIWIFEQLLEGARAEAASGKGGSGTGGAAAVIGAEQMLPVCNMVMATCMNAIAHARRTGVVLSTDVPDNVTMASISVAMDDADGGAHEEGNGRANDVDAYAQRIGALAQSVFAEMGRNGWKPRVRDYTVMMRIYILQRRPQCALDLYAECKEQVQAEAVLAGAGVDAGLGTDKTVRKNESHTYLLTLALQACAEQMLCTNVTIDAQQHKPKYALKLKHRAADTAIKTAGEILDEARQWGVQPNIITLTELTKLRSWHARILARWRRTNDQPDGPTADMQAAVRMCDNFSRSYDLHWRRDAHLVALMMLGLSHNYETDAAVQLFKDYVAATPSGADNAKESRPSVVLFNALIHAHATAPGGLRIEQAREAFAEVFRSGLEPDNATLSSLYDAYIRAPGDVDLDGVFSALKEFTGRGGDVCPASFNKIISLCTRAGVLNTKFEAAGDTWQVGEAPATATDIDVEVDAANDAGEDEDASP